MTYLKAQNFLNSFINYERLKFFPYNSFKLERVKKLLQLLGNPHKTLCAIHIAGTKGKGSTCACVANILREAGFKVGLYTSPHLVDVRERIRILQSPESRVQSPEKEEISRKDFARLIRKIKPHAEKLRETKLGRLSYFEILTSMAFLYFQEEECDFVVLETGIGGRLDATNVVSSLVCAITSISYEHTYVLGTTLKKIATEKAGIIKTRAQRTEHREQSREDRRQIVVTAPQRFSALKVIRSRAKKLGAKLFEVGEDIKIREKFSSIRGQSFDVKGIFGTYLGLKIGLLGKHQLVNAATAVAVAESLQYRGTKISEKAIREGLRKTHWPGRLQIISRRPKVVLDAAHNQASACVLKDALTKVFKFRNLILVFGVSWDKDVQGILKELVPCASRIILTKAQNPRALEPEIIKAFIKTNEKPIAITQNSIQALKVARRNARKQDLILVSGSLFLVGEVLKNAKRLFNADGFRLYTDVYKSSR